MSLNNNNEKILKRYVWVSSRVAPDFIARKMEKENGFDEAIYSKKLKKKMSFFNLGSMNKWKNVIPEDYHNKINTSFEEDLKFLKYT